MYIEFVSEFVALLFFPECCDLFSAVLNDLRY